MNTVETPVNAEDVAVGTPVDVNVVPKGTKINDVFNVFANLAPSSPWSAHLRTIQTIFNHLAEGAVLLDTCPHVNLSMLIVDEDDQIAAEEPIKSGAKQWNQGIEQLRAAMAMMRPVKVEVPADEATPA
jgi:hypothetical protein